MDREGAAYFDFGGSGVVHMTGGIGALLGAIACGPRPDRFTKPEEYVASNIVLVYLGTFILWFGWYGFNPGSTGGMSSGHTAMTASLCATTTTLAAVAGAGVSFALHRLRSAVAEVAQSENDKFAGDKDAVFLCNGALAGLVGITAGCGNVQPWAAIVIGMLSGILYHASSTIVQCFKIDDPLDAFSIHGACGFLGVIAAPIFDLGGDGLFYGWGDGSSIWYNATQERWEGITKLEQLGIQLLTALAITGWTTFSTGSVFLMLKKFAVLTEDHEVLVLGVETAKKKKVERSISAIINSAKKNKQRNRTRKGFFEVEETGFAKIGAILRKLHNLLC